jgi:hypothetical protein
MALVLLIMGVMLSVSLPLLNRITPTQSKAKTLQHHERLFHILGGYLMARHALPCPAPRTLEGSQAGIAVLNCNEAEKAVGYLPYKTLGLSAKDALDSAGFPLIYGVTPFFTHDFRIQHQEETPCLVESPPLTRLKVLDAQGQEVVPVQEKGLVVCVVLVSPGQAFSTPQGPYETENLSSSLTFHDRPFSLSPPFRHQVSWVTSLTLITQYGQGQCQKETIAPLRQPHSPSSAYPPPSNPVSNFDGFGLPPGL